jgi:hypothetical protein
MNETKISVATTVAIFLFIATVMLFSSCRTGRQVVVVEGKDSIRIEERVREIKVTDTLFVEVPMQKESTTVRDSMSHLENDYAISDARIMADGSLYHSLETKPRTDTLTQELSVQAKDSIIYREKVVPKIVPVEKGLSDWQKIQIRGFWIFLILTSVYIIIRKKVL